MPLPKLDKGVAHSFGARIDGVLIDEISEVSGLKMEQDVIELKQNTKDGKYMVKKLPGRPKPGEITLVRGASADNNFEKWIKAARLGQDVGVSQEWCDHHLRLRGRADQALHDDQRVAEEPGDHHSQGR